MASLPNPVWARATLRRPGLAVLVATKGRPTPSAAVLDSLTPDPLVVLCRCRTVTPLVSRLMLALVPKLVISYLMTPRLKLLLFRWPPLVAVSILRMLLFTLTTDMLKALLFRLHITIPRLALPLTLQVKVVVAGLPTTCPILTLVTPLVLPAVRCRVLAKQVGMATIVLAIALFRQVLVLRPSPRRTTVDILRGAQVPLLMAIPQLAFTLCPTDETAWLGVDIVRRPVIWLMTCLLLPPKVIIEGAAWVFLVPGTMAVLLFLTIVM